MNTDKQQEIYGDIPADTKPLSKDYLGAVLPEGFAAGDKKPADVEKKPEGK